MDTCLGQGTLIDQGIRRAISQGKIKSMNRVVPFGVQQGRPFARQVCVNEKIHVAVAGSIRLMRLRRAAYASAARMSSRSRSS